MKKFLRTITAIGLLFLTVKLIDAADLINVRPPSSIFLDSKVSKTGDTMSGDLNMNLGTKIRADTVRANFVRGLTGGTTILYETMIGTNIIASQIGVYSIVTSTIYASVAIVPVLDVGSVRITSAAIKAMAADSMGVGTSGYPTEDGALVVNKGAKTYHMWSQSLNAGVVLFGGMYEMTGVICTSSNPFTGSCTCPGGMTAYPAGATSPLYLCCGQ